MRRALLAVAIIALEAALSSEAEDLNNALNEVYVIHSPNVNVPAIEYIVPEEVELEVVSYVPTSSGWRQPQCSASAKLDFR